MPKPNPARQPRRENRTDKPNRGSGGFEHKRGSGAGGSKPRRQPGSASTFRSKSTDRGKSPDGGKFTDRRQTERSSGSPRKPDVDSRTVRSGWGSVTRKGATKVVRPDDAARKRRDEASPEFEPTRVARWKRDDEGDGRSRGGGPLPRPEPFSLSDIAVSEIEKAVGSTHAERPLRYLRDAAKAYASDRFGDAKRHLRVPLELAPHAPSVKELHGMILYRQGKWAAAIKELRAAHLLTADYALYPAMMDAHRALGQLRPVESLWDELRAASPDAETMAEGRIVWASALAENDRIVDGIRTLEKAPKPKNKPKLHHLRTLYVLADLVDRAGDATRARTLFTQIANSSPGFADVEDRIRSLS